MKFRQRAGLLILLGLMWAILVFDLPPTWHLGIIGGAGVFLFLGPLDSE